ncbi:hypothetical protein HDU97_001796 [Phlyctochytrium planicorne]|nr:hypothetical protein HDU97_001796 [Phlyctochytrium planicorne]
MATVSQHAVSDCAIVQQIYPNRNISNFCCGYDEDGIGVGCTSDGIVDILKITYGYGGPITIGLGELSELESLEIIGGDILHLWQMPVDWEKLTKLKRLAIDTYVGGPIPPFIGKMTNLTELVLKTNRFWGPIPSEFESLVNLEVLEISSGDSACKEFEKDKIDGLIPAFIGKMKNLRALNLSGHRLTGPIPPDLGELSKLESLQLFCNLLTGPIPVELGRLQLLKTLDLSNNIFRSPLPDMFQSMTSLTSFVSKNAFLKGLLPESLSVMFIKPSFNMDLSRNLLRGSVPDSWTSITCNDDYCYLYLRMNQLFGDIPIGFLEAVKLARQNSSYLSVALDDNYFSGPAFDVFDYDSSDIGINKNCFGERGRNEADCARFSALATATATTATATETLSINLPSTTLPDLKTGSLSSKTVETSSSTLPSSALTNNLLIVRPVSELKGPSSSSSLPPTTQIGSKTYILTPTISIFAKPPDASQSSTSDESTDAGGFFQSHNLAILISIAVGTMACLITAAFVTGLFIGRKRKRNEKLKKPAALSASPMSNLWGPTLASQGAGFLFTSRLEVMQDAFDESDYCEASKGKADGKEEKK